MLCLNKLAAGMDRSFVVSITFLEPEANSVVMVKAATLVTVGNSA